MVEYNLSNEGDSLAYIIGMNIADNLLKMDSTINVNAVCTGIIQKISGKSVISANDARTYYLRYVNYVQPEKRRGYEEQYLTDMAKSDRELTRTQSGLVYNIMVIGDESVTPRNNNEILALRYIIKRDPASEAIYSSYDRQDTTKIELSKLITGMGEGVKMIGNGCKFKAWLPSS